MTLAEQFITESNKIEGIIRPPKKEEIAEFDRFMELDEVKITDLVKFVSVYQPGAVLRDKKGLDVRVGNYFPPRGGKEIKTALQAILDMANGNIHNPFHLHIEYETLHPFTDCNGRSGRMLWAWHYEDLRLGFLHRFYYQTLAHSR